MCALRREELRPLHEPDAGAASQSSVDTQALSQVRHSQHTEDLGNHRGRAAAAATPRRLDCENGVIRTIKLENFKNHINFELALGPHANFIKGPNGSGKSSVLAAIINDCRCALL